MALTLNFGNISLIVVVVYIIVVDGFFPSEATPGWWSLAKPS